MQIKGIRRIAHVMRCVPSALFYSVEYEGITLIDFTLNKKRRTLFQSCAQNGLGKIKDLNPKRFRRVQAHLKSIANFPSKLSENWAEFYKSGDFCSVNFKALRDSFQVDEESPDICAYFLGAVFVHEATHGYLLSKGHEYTKQTWLQSERICHAEEMRMAKLFGENFYSLYYHRFDPENYRERWRRRQPSWA